MANIAHYIEICKKYSVFPAPELHWELPFPGWVWWAASPSSMGWRGGGAHHFPTFLTSPKVVFSWKQKMDVLQSLCWQHHRIIECFGSERSLKMVQFQSPTVSRDAALWLEKSLLLREFLSRIISIFYEPQSRSSTAGVFYFLLLYLFSFTS